MSFSPFFLLPLLLDLQSVDLNWKMTWFSSAACSLLYKNQHASSREIWTLLLLSFPLSLSLSLVFLSFSFFPFYLCNGLSLCCLFLFICCKGQSSAARLCCQKPLFTKGRNKWLTQTTSFIPASPQALFPSTARGTPPTPLPPLTSAEAPHPNYTAPLHPWGSQHTSPLPWVAT